MNVKERPPTKPAGSNVRHIGPRSLGASVRMPTTFLALAEVFGITAPAFESAPKVFGFRRERREGVWGWRIELSIGPLTLCTRWANDIPFPRRRVDAEAWAYEFAARHGFAALKHAPPARRRKRPELRLVPPLSTAETKGPNT